jgi:hypothetical protein
LTSAAALVKTYVDQHVAHRDRRPKAGFPTFADLDGAMTSSARCSVGTRGCSGTGRSRITCPRIKTIGVQFFVSRGFGRGQDTRTT